MYRYLVIIEKTADGYSAYAPDVPGVGTVGDTVAEILANMQDALELYMEVALERGQPMPAPSATQSGFVEIDESRFATRASA